MFYFLIFTVIRSHPLNVKKRRKANDLRRSVSNIYKAHWRREKIPWVGKPGMKFISRHLQTMLHVSAHLSYRALSFDQTPADYEVWDFILQGQIAEICLYVWFEILYQFYYSFFLQRKKYQNRFQGSKRESSSMQSDDFS